MESLLISTCTNFSDFQPAPGLEHLQRKRGFLCDIARKGGK